MTDTIEDLVEAGVIDPAKVTRNVFLNACSICEIMLTTQALVTGIQPGDRFRGRIREMRGAVIPTRHPCQRGWGFFDGAKETDSWPRSRSRSWKSDGAAPPTPMPQLHSTCARD